MFLQDALSYIASKLVCIFLWCVDRIRKLIQLFRGGDEDFERGANVGHARWANHIGTANRKEDSQTGGCAYCFWSLANVAPSNWLERLRL